MLLNITCPLKHSGHPSGTTSGQLEKATQTFFFELYVNQLQPSTFWQKFRQEFSPKVIDSVITMLFWHSPLAKHVVSLSEKKQFMKKLT